MLITHRWIPLEKKEQTPKSQTNKREKKYQIPKRTKITTTIKKNRGTQKKTKTIIEKKIKKKRGKKEGEKKNKKR